MYKNAFNKQNGKNIGIAKTEKTVDECLLEFVSEQSSINSWSDGTIYKFNTLKKHLKEFKPDVKMSDFKSSFYIHYID